MQYFEERDGKLILLQWRDCAGRSMGTGQSACPQQSAW